MIWFDLLHYPFQNDDNWRNLACKKKENINRHLVKLNYFQMIGIYYLFENS